MVIHFRDSLAPGLFISTLMVAMGGAYHGKNTVQVLYYESITSL